MCLSGNDVSCSLCCGTQLPSCEDTVELLLLQGAHRISKNNNVFIC